MAPRAIPSSSPGPRERATAIARRLSAVRPELLALLALAAALNLWALSRNGYANEYYAAAVKSMAASWHAFLFGSFDAGSLQTVDKPPAALWVQALSVRAFGFSSWALLVPQALMGVAAVGLTYDLVRRVFGRAGGFVGGFALAVTPIAVAVARHNNPDALLVLCSVGALWALVRALQDGRTRWLVLSGVCIGLGFETKMAAALIIVPALVAAYLWAAPPGRLVAVTQLLWGGLAVAVVGLAWPLLITVTPATDRPWISGTSDNSVWSLIFGYNGLGRVDGQAGGPGGGGPGGGGTMFGGDPGPLRLLNEALGGQAGWLLGFAAASLVVVAVATRLRRADGRTGWLIATGGAFLTIAAVFSFARGIFHPYYVSLLAPFAAALVGAGAVELVRASMLARIAAPLAIAAGVGVELAVLHSQVTLPWLAPLLGAGGAVAAIALATPIGARGRAWIVGGVLGLAAIAPATWSVQTLGHAASGTFPMGGPATAGMGGGGFPGGPGGGGPGGRGVPGPAPGGFGGPPGGTFPPGGGAFPRGGPAMGGPRAGGFGGFGGASSSLSEAIAYVRRHGGDTLGVSSQSSAASAVLRADGDVSVAGLGGFSGNESEVSVPWLAQAVEDGRIRYVLVDGASGGGFRDGRVGASELMEAVQQAGEQTSVAGLYDLRGRADRLRALAG
jgi:4-amino-4-deoxy-L-arabinose transferase-like glycosyltransferase